MNELQIFNNPVFGQVRTIEDDGKILFCGNDVAKALGYKVPKDAIAAHCKGAVIRRLPTNGGEQDAKFIPEGDIYRLAAKSELPSADDFERWIFDEVIPSIRRTGGYITGQNELSPEELMAKALMVAQKTLAEREARISALTVDNTIMKPKAEYFDELVDRNLLTNFRETAKELGVGPKVFVAFLLGKKYVYRDKKGKLLPYQPHVDSGLFEVKECTNEKTQWSGTQTLVTPKGRETFRLLYLKTA
ncbi:phage antirepressor KilAC domain-containing protein [Anaeromassilibacillus senegalensis]|uniref:phage antirepressor KilAC domain-containing protein n=1 Tax=Anaeromassilibacillus senegalensis TaxID=1673717 RepID=UPI0006824F34|nr:phage antirepressor KilAC domain-containing protein [Anaeromassilibacillus senegalensis]